MRLLITLFLAVVSFLNANAQFDSTRQSQPYPLLNVKVDFANFINPEDPSVLASLELSPFTKYLSITQEVGFVSGIRSHYDVDIRESFKYRGGVRFYPIHEGNVFFYSGADFQYRNLTISDQYILGYECENGRCVYYRNFSGDFVTRRYAYQLRLGAQARFDRFILEGDIGFGEYVMRLEGHSALKEAVIVERNRYLNQEAFGRHFFMTVGAKVGFILIKSK